MTTNKNPVVALLWVFPLMTSGDGVPAFGESGLSRHVLELAAPDLARREAAYQELLAAGDRDPEGVLAALPVDTDDLDVSETVARLRGALDRKIIRRDTVREAGANARLRGTAEALFSTPSIGSINRFIEAWGPVHPRAAGLALVPFLDDRVGDIRAHVAGALGSLGEKGAAPKIARLVTDPDENVQTSAIMVLCKLDPAQLVPCLAHPDPVLRQTIAELLMLHCQDRSVAGGLAKLLGDPDVGVRATAIRALGKFGAREHLPDLVLVMKGENPFGWAERTFEDRAAAAEALMDMGDATILPGMADLLSHPDRVVGEIAGVVLVNVMLKTKDRAIVPVLVRFLSDPNPVVRGDAACVLGDAGVREAGPEVMRLLSDPDAYVRTWAIHAVGALGEKSAVPALRKALSDGDPWVRGKALEVLMRMEERVPMADLMALLADPDHENRKRAASALECLGDPSLAGGLIRLAKGLDPSVAPFCLYVLGVLKDSAVVPEVAGILQDPASDEVTRLAAAHAIRNLVGKKLAEEMDRVSGNDPAFHPGFQLVSEQMKNDVAQAQEAVREIALVMGRPVAGPVDAGKERSAAADQIAVAMAWWERNKGKPIPPAPTEIPRRVMTGGVFGIQRTR